MKATRVSWGTACKGGSCRENLISLPSCICSSQTGVLLFSFLLQKLFTASTCFAPWAAVNDMSFSFLFHALRGKHMLGVVSLEITIKQMGFCIARIRTATFLLLVMNHSFHFALSRTYGFRLFSVSNVLAIYVRLYIIIRPWSNRTTVYAHLRNNRP